MRELRASMWTLILASSLVPVGAAANGPPGGGPNPGGNPNPPVPLNTAMPAPYDLEFATDPATCDKWRTGLPARESDPCLDLANRPDSGTFHWQWRGNAAHPKAPGFNMYRVDGGHHDRVVQQYSADEGDTIIMFNVVPGACYAVTAWDLTPAESAASPSYCVNTVRQGQPPPRMQGPVPVSPGTPVQMMTRLPAPSRPLPMKDPKACGPHGGLAAGLACQALLPKGGLALVWDYGPAHIDGFRAFEVPSAPVGGPGMASAALARPAAPIATQAQRLDNGSVATIVVLDPRPRGFDGACFAVSAFLGSEESEKSPTFCLAAGPPPPR